MAVGIIVVIKLRYLMCQKASKGAIPVRKHKKEKGGIMRKQKAKENTQRDNAVVIADCQVARQVKRPRDMVTKMGNSKEVLLLMYEQVALVENKVEVVMDERRVGEGSPGVVDLGDEVIFSVVNEQTFELAVGRRPPSSALRPASIEEAS
ncbi:hypothetical protein K1719_032147 [Acacia pycnantha]|nr:hypothetical protein K1719_032147 [Acacia pycnantha]